MAGRLVRKSLLIAASWLAIHPALLLGQVSAAQPPAVPEWQIAAGGKMAFEVASIKPDPGPFRPPNFPLDPGEAYRPVGGRFSADFSLTTYITFAYKLSLSSDQRQAMVAHLPSWVAAERFDIQARAEGNPTKDQMRLMMQSLLADRFKLAVHFETQVVPVLALVLVKPGKTGPKLRPHSEGVPCEATPATNGPIPRDSTVFPPVCDVYMMTMHPNTMSKSGSRNTTMALLAGALSGLGKLDRPVVDQTGLDGRFDFSIEWAHESDRPPLPNSDAPAELQGPTFLEALREQLGLKLQSTKAPLQILVVDHVERPSD
ncbi:MAG TPA: TIGR03435 family protein, partial [Bryobacteraceae bacterium]|nr:TIGR03435 family protein [Bryobacteraceae bacterium]